jgi:hypothetical protein
MTHIESSHDVYIKYVFNKMIAARLLHLLTETHIQVATSRIRSRSNFAWRSLEYVLLPGDILRGQNSITQNWIVYWILLVGGIPTPLRNLSQWEG